MIHFKIPPTYIYLMILFQKNLKAGVWAALPRVNICIGFDVAVTELKTLVCVNVYVYVCVCMCENPRMWLGKCNWPKLVSTQVTCRTYDIQWLRKSRTLPEFQQSYIKKYHMWNIKLLSLYILFNLHLSSYNIIFHKAKNTQKGCVFKLPMKTIHVFSSTI